MKKNIASLEELSIDIPLEFSPYDLVRRNSHHFQLRKGKEYTCSSCGCVTSDQYPECPKCHTSLIPFHIKSNTNFDRLSKQFWIIVLQKTSDRIVERWFIAYQDINPNSLVSQVQYEEVERNTIINGQVSSISKGRYYLNQGEWCYGYKYVDNFNGKTPRKRIEIYPKYSQMESWLSDTELKYTTIGKWFEQQEEPNTKSYATFAKLAFAAKYSWIEKVYKSGLKKLWIDLIRSYEVDFRKVRPSRILKYRKELLQIEGGWPQLYALISFAQLNQTVNIDFIKHQKDIKEIDKLIQFHKLSSKPIQKILNYLVKNEIMDENLRTYVDYLSMLHQIYPGELDDIVVFPKDIEKAHEDMIQKFNALKLEKEEKEWEAIKTKLMKYEYKSQNYAIVVPNNLNEVLHEGRCLKHCVGSYVPEIIKGKKAILFVRDIENIEQPLYTLEYSNDSIVQCRGLDNKSAPPHITSFLNEWEKKLKRKLKKKSPVPQNISIAA